MKKIQPDIATFYYSTREDAFKDSFERYAKYH
jgi:hypothetical protein